MTATATTGWWIGLVVGFFVVVVVVAVVAIVLTFASRVVDRSADVVDALGDARAGASALRDLDRAHDGSAAILAGFQAARRVLPGGR